MIDVSKKYNLSIEFASLLILFIVKLGTSSH
jgi:hypothetical protein